MNKSANYLKGYGATLCKGLLLVSIMLFSALSMYAQQGSRTISGIVVDENGEPLPGAHVMQQKEKKSDSQAAVAVDMNGHFSLTIPASTKAIEVSYLGYDTKVVKLTAKKN